MGKKSIKENKNIYQLSREALSLTREQAAELMDFISDDRIEKIESEKSLPHPDEVLVMSEAYKRPELCNYFCSHECMIGKKYVPEIVQNDFSQIVLEMLANLNALNKDKERLIEISADGKITEDEYNDFIEIREKLEKLSLATEAMQLWVERKIAEGEIDL